MAARTHSPAIPRPRRAGVPTPTASLDRVSRWASVVTVRGEVDLVTAPAVRETLNTALRDPDLLLLVVDLSPVDFLAAAGLGVLVEVRDRARARAVDLRLVATGRVVLRPLDVTGLRRTFQLHDRVDTPLARYADTTSR
ncbi:anti-sigma factor antagonist [Actinokineospora inagensis]|uniref:anti-sigma factor antagonist n=1 Tax=Actinokineospora inagensis TaxID=103730 RepID=UPI00040DC0E4|nr:anti-sigma factor antagonist [Actinokineospora inagensis]